MCARVLRALIEWPTHIPSTEIALSCPTLSDLWPTRRKLYANYNARDYIVLEVMHDTQSRLSKMFDHF